MSTMTESPADVGLEVALENLGDAVLVHIKGAATYDQAEELRRLLRPLAEESPRLLVLDLAGLSEASSLALGAMVELRWQVAQRWGEVRLARLQPTVRQQVSAVGLHRYFPIYESVQEALTA